LGGHGFVGLFVVEFVDEAVFAFEVAFVAGPDGEFFDFWLIVTQVLSPSFLVYVGLGLVRLGCP
jgi:hypothetical protein